MAVFKAGQLLVEPIDDILVGAVGPLQLFVLLLQLSQLVVPLREQLLVGLGAFASSGQLLPHVGQLPVLVAQ